MLKFLVICSALLGSQVSHAGLNHRIEGVFQDAVPQQADDRALWKRKATFTPQEFSIIYTYYEPKDPKTPVIERRLRGTYKLEAVPPSSTRHFRMTVKIAESRLVQKTASKLGQSMGIAPCAKVNIALNLRRNSCGDFTVEDRRAYYRVFLEDPKTLLLSGPSHSRKTLGSHLSIFPLKKTTR